MYVFSCIFQKQSDLRKHQCDVYFEDDSIPSFNPHNYPILNLSQPGEWPWIVVFSFDAADGSQAGGCGGTLVADRWVAIHQRRLSHSLDINASLLFSTLLQTLTTLFQHHCHKGLFRYYVITDGGGEFQS